MTRAWIRWCRLGLAVFVACWAATLARSLANSQVPGPMNKTEQPQRDKVSTQILGGPDRYLTSVSTDKPIYRAGEKVYVRGVVLNAANHQPLVAGHFANAIVQIKGPKGDVVASGNASAEESVWGFAWEIPDGQAGGEYTIHVTYPWDGHAPAERKFDIRAYRAPRLRSQITFLRDGYGPGDKVNATLEVTRAEGGVPENAKVSVIARVDGVEIQGATSKVDAKGLCSVSFDLPRAIARGEGTLALVIEDGGVVETASKTIPILLQTVDLQMYPEGGDLIAGYKNRVYVQATQPNGKPADLVAKLMCKQQSQPISVFRTEHEGRGRFEFTPDAGKQYYLTISEPAGIKSTYPLPEIHSRGAVIHSDKDVFEKAQPVTVHVGATDKGFRVALSKREVEVAVHKVEANSHRGILQAISFAVPPNVDGVLTITVSDENGHPLAERLIYRSPARPLNISITPDKKSYAPGENAKISVLTTDVDGKPVSALVGFTVTDDSVLEMVEKRDQAPRLPVMVLLEPEVKDLADAHVYLDPKNPKAPLATDLLLGTQGWRRFALMDLAKFIEKYGDLSRRVVALKIQAQVEMEKAQQAQGNRFGGFAVPRGAAVGNAFFKAPEEPMQEAAGRKGPAKKDLALNEVAANVPVDVGRLQAAIMKEAKIVNRRQAFNDKREIESQLSSFVFVREFAHEVRHDRKPSDRVDFTETLYWNTGIKTDPKTGKATISFGLNDSVTTFRVFADAFASDGAIGGANIGLEAVKPFYAEAKLPLEVTAGDQVQLPITLINATGTKLADGDVKVSLTGDSKLSGLQKGASNINAGERVRYIQPINVGAGNGTQDFVLTAIAGPYEDRVTRKLAVKPKGFPIETTFGGMLEAATPVVHTITIPKEVVAGSMVCNSAVYPTPLANLSEALERMIQDPYGCFEQTSSTSYPLTMAQQYFLSHTGIEPKLVESARQKLDAGYKRLVGFWCPDRGYEWFGENPGHEALTAFGLLHFTDMAQVRDVDQNMVNSTRSWLLKQKDGHGGFTRKRRALHTWIEDKDCSNAYILWALLECGQPPADLQPEIEALKGAAAATNNSYVVALAANALHLAGMKSEATKLMDRLAAKQNSDGSVSGVKSSIVGSGGESLEVEGTALATLAWLRNPAYAGNVERSIKYLADSCKGGRYGSTQATVLALRAIVTYDKQRARPKAPGKVRISVDGQPIGDWATFNQSTEGAIKLPDLSELLSPGEHKLEIRMDGGSPMPYSIAVKYNALTPASSKDCVLNLAVKMAQSKVVEGASTEANVTVTNKSKEVVPTPVAIIGLPGGLEPRHNQLKELVKKGTIDAYEVLGREVVLYWRTLAGAAKVEVPLSLIASVPGKYTGPASRAYLYYTDEHKQWVDGLQVEIAPTGAKK